MVPTVSPAMAARRFIPLLDAACRRIGEPWFHVAVNRTGRSASIAYRERVYCYELYHQLRMLADSPDGREAGAPDYVLFGEIDKSGLHAVTEDGKEKPDLVWHVPGTPHNAAVLEVKHASRLTHDGLAKDLTTLGTFLTAGADAYSLGVLLVFGRAKRDQVLHCIQRAASAGQVDNAWLQDALLLWHSAVGANLEDLGAIT